MFGDLQRSDLSLREVVNDLEARRGLRLLDLVVDPGRSWS